MEITGKIHIINDTQTFESGFEKREFVVKTNENYPQLIKCELVKDKCSLLDNFQPGQEVTVSINLRGNQYNGKYYVNIQAWRIKEEESNAAPSGNIEGKFQEEAIQQLGNQMDDDDMPF